MPHLIGAHTLDTGGIHMAARRAGAAGMQALQVFTAIPKYYNEKVGVKPDRVARFREALDAAGIRPGHVVAHAAYVINTASQEPDKAQRAALALAKELERACALGIGAVCFHPGSAGTDSVEAGCERVAAAMTFALERAEGSARLLVENTAGAGRTIGRSPEEVGMILSRIPSALRPRAGFGLDTCHLHASGHPIAESPERQRAVLDAFERAAGERPAFLHLNDSQGAFASNRDRHMLLGEGTIGVEPFRWLLADERSRGIPLILETPQERAEVAEDDATADPWEVRMVGLLRELA